MNEPKKRRDIARRIRRNRVAEGFRNNEELVEAIYAERSDLIDPTLLDAVEACRIDCPDALLEVLAEFHVCAIEDLTGTASAQRGKRS